MTEGANTGSSKASASASVSVDEPSSLKDDCTKIRFVPCAWMLAVMLSRTPLPMDIITVTDVMPITMPSSVSPDLSLLLPSERSAVITMSIGVIRLPRLATALAHALAAAAPRRQRARPIR